MTFTSPLLAELAPVSGRISVSAAEYSPENLLMTFLTRSFSFEAMLMRAKVAGGRKSFNLW